MTSFEIKLHCKIYVDKNKERGVSLNVEQRSTVIGVVSISDFEIENPFKSSELIIHKSRENLQSNHFNVTVTIPEDSKRVLNGYVVLRSTLSDASVKIPIRFNPEQKIRKVEPRKKVVEQKPPKYDIE